MIQTKNPVLPSRIGEHGKIKIEVRQDERTETGRKFLVIDWNLANTESAHFSKYVERSDSDIDSMESYIEQNYDLSGLTREDREYRKLQIALFIETTTINLSEDGNTIYGLKPEDWEFCDFN